MELSQQVVSLELAKKLKELGVKQESYFWWNRLSDYPDSTPDWRLSSFKSVEVARELCSAFTVAELGEMLKLGMEQSLFMNMGKWYCSYHSKSPAKKNEMDGNTEADARAKMLIYLLENKLIDL